MAQISTDLSRLRPARWFAVPPAADMVALRQTWSDTLTRRLDELRMLPKLTAFAALRQEFFSRSGTFARERLDLYLRLHELTDLRNYCDRFKIPLELDPAGAFWEGYGRLSRATIPDGPGASLCFKVGDHANDPALARVRPGDEEVQIPMGERFHEVADAQEDLDMFGEGRKRALEYTGRKALPLPPLEEVEELEISGLASDLARNSRFVISLGTDRTSFEEMAVVRMVGGQLRPFWHTVERSLLEGSRLFVKVNLRLLPRMDGAHEYAYLPRLTVRCRLRARPPSPAQ
ncbi:MAG: hypothetical protein HY815_02645 [Candidatus Riflebacteria bacterium]|nr:hypothetical protein [Candidatus Riflebacteria bacterium]